jgi:hypothetical protein
MTAIIDRENEPQFGPSFSGDRSVLRQCFWSPQENKLHYREVCLKISLHLFNYFSVQLSDFGPEKDLNYRGYTVRYKKKILEPVPVPRVGDTASNKGIEKFAGNLDSVPMLILL